MAPTPTLQSVILKLQEFWAERGCLIWQPYYTQVGAGTMNPATFLRVLGPEPWRVAYVEPSIRPDDGRYGENPNRMQQFYQFQVILKPDPGDPQEIYLDSLLALGIDPARHDLRFVEDRWEAPALGAWGLGWEVWLDGQEISQFTYFQQAGGQSLDPVSVEITYGLERILIGLLSLDHFREIPWTATRSYGDVLLKAEEEHTRYYHEHADVERLRQMYVLARSEARSALERGLVLPAYDYLLKCSHTFNVLDSRGAVGVAERAAFFGEMRDLARRLAEAYLEQRRQLGFPWLEAQASPARAGLPADDTPPPATPQDFLLEIGTEELPVGDLAAALEAIPAAAEELLAAHRLAHAGVRSLGTPRRLILMVEGLTPKQDDVVELVKGPPEARAFDASGAPTQAARGWARRHDLADDPESLRTLVRSIDGGSYLAAEVRRPGREATAVMAKEVLPALVARLAFDQTMRWIGTGGEAPEDVALRRTAFARPIRWLTALHGEHVVPFEVAGLRAGRETRGLRFDLRGPLHLSSAADYLAEVRERGVVVDPAERRRLVAEQAAALAAEVGGRAEDDPALLEEVAHLVEAPHALRGAFDPSFLQLPEEVLTAVMKKHQRYFPLRSAEGKLLPFFLAVRNGRAETEDEIRAGNEHVLRARFADAAFFLAKDRAQPLESFRPQLARLTFHARLGSMLDKTERLEALAPKLAAEIGFPVASSPTLARAARLCKADLATALVTEMTSLQGVLGRIYARESGEPEAVAQAILEHYLPRFAGDALPEAPEGITLALADRLDSLCGLFAVGEQPSGARDPLGMRRAAAGVVLILTGRSLRADLRRWLEMAAAGLPVPATPESLRACLDFIVARQEGLLLAQGRSYDVVAAALSAQGHDPAGAARAAVELEAAVAAPDWAPVLQAYARCARITRGQAVDGAVDADRLEMDAERSLLAGLEAVPGPIDSVVDLVSALRRLVPPITVFFDQVLVMDEDPRLRETRLALVQRVVRLADEIADLSKLEGF